MEEGYLMTWNIFTRINYKKLAKLKHEMMLSFLKMHNGSLVQYEYYEKAFGDFLCKIEYKNEIHTFTTDRGDIYHNSILVCDHSFHVTGQDDLFIKLLEVIRDELHF